MPFLALYEKYFRRFKQQQIPARKICELMVAAAPAIA